MQLVVKPCLLFALTLVFASFSVQAQSQQSIQGRIIEVRGYRMSGLMVNALDRETGQKYETYTDDNGSFTFNPVQPGRYVLSAECPGIQQVISAVNVSPGQKTEVDMIALAFAPTGNVNVDKFIASMAAQGGRYPSGNMSYLNASDDLDIYFMLIYFGILGLLSAYGAYRYRLIYIFLRYYKHKPEPKSRYTPNELPRITIQLPFYNEMYVAQRLIDCVTKIDYPCELLEIQVLDDSTDETQRIATEVVSRYSAEGFDISYHHREDRTGFKAGALAQGLKQAKGDFILIFDADFMPRPDCIRRMIDYFTDEKIAMVQMRWSHINADYSLLTRIQAIMLDGHFVIEQTARSRTGGFFNFNGTAGMWRRRAIEWSGGWQHDTLAEDTDLSFRAQLMGWNFIYLLDDDVPSELPVEINAFKSQQRRWAKGLIEIGMKMLGRMMKDPRLPKRVKVEQFLRLTGNLAAPLVIVLAVINFPILIVRYNQGFFHLFVLDVPILALSTLSVMAFYIVPQWYLYPKTWKKSIKYMPFVMSLGIALTFSNARATLEALFGIKTAFIRTPKFGIQDNADSTWVKKSYLSRGFALPILEILFALYFIFTVYYAIKSNILGTLPFLLVYLFGYGYAAAMSLAQMKMNLRKANKKR